MPGSLFQQPEGVITIEGVLERITFANEENAWSVVKLSLPGRRDPITAVGNLLGVQPGENLRLTGQWVSDRKYGEQFKVSSYVSISPATLVGIRKYLGSGLVRGIGPVMAERLVQKFGLETLEVIETTPERLGEVEGIGPVRTVRIRDAWVEQRGIKDVMIFLQSQEISTGYAVKIFKHYGDRAIAVVKEDPYRLAADIFGIGFKTADRIAANIGIPKTSPRRACAGVLHVLGQTSDEGHVFYPRDLLTGKAAEMLEIEAALVAAAIEEMARAGWIVVERLGETLGKPPGETGRHETDRLDSGRQVSAQQSAGPSGPAGPALGGHDAPVHASCPAPVASPIEDREREPGAASGRGTMAASPAPISPREASERLPAPGGTDPGQVVYLKSLHTAEAGIAERLRSLIAARPRPLAIDVEKALAWFEGKQGISLAAQQQQAIRRAITARALVITGGPGTGKTTLVNGIIRILEKKGRRILLAAPTGRAAKRLEEATGRGAKTIHRLLEFSPKTGAFARDRAHPLEADLVVVDEASMLDTVLAYNLLKALPEGCQLVLVGDVDQIPSVGPGSVLGDLIRSGAVDVVRLTEIFRQAEKSLIVVSAHRVNRGEMPLPKAAAVGGERGAGEGADGEGGGEAGKEAREEAERGAGEEAKGSDVGDGGLAGHGAASDFFFVERKTPEEILATLKTLVAERIPRRFGFDPVEDIQVLTPMHRGILGASNLNAELQGLLNPSGDALVRGTRSFRVADKVMQIRNNYDLEVFNGDIGRVAAIDDIERQVRVRYEERIVAYDYTDLDDLVLAYACSIHKAQGSEYTCVVVPLHTQHYIMLQRNLLYTAITRGKRLVVLVGSRRALGIAVRNARVEARYTRLAERLRPGAKG